MQLYATTGICSNQCYTVSSLRTVGVVYSTVLITLMCASAVSDASLLVHSHALLTVLLPIYSLLHAAFLLNLFNGVLDCDNGIKAWFRTGELRSIVIES
jgi:hypothetical protein